MEQQLVNTNIPINKKFSFPSVSVLGILVSVLLFTLVSTLLWQFLQNKKISKGLQGVYVTDINDRSAIVSWVTSQPNKTELIYSNKEIKSILNVFNSKIGYDRRDIEEIGEFEYKLKRRGNYYVHSVVLRELSPQTEFHFAIRNGIFLSDAVYVNTFTTLTEREKVDSPEVGYGNIYNQDGNLISDTLVFFELTNKDDTNRSQRVSYVMDGKRGWSVNISNLMDSKFEEEYVKEKETYLGVYIVNAQGEISKIVSLDKIKPAENVSAYDNEYDEKQSDVKGVMAVLCECKSCTPSCPSGYSSTYPTGYNYVTAKPTCTSRDACTGEFCETITGAGTCYKATDKIETCKQECQSCTPICPTGYKTTCPDGWNCSEMRSACEKYEKCTGEPCGTQSGSTCYKPTTEKVECICYPCTPKCPEGFSEKCEEGYNCTTAPAICYQEDTCGVRCGEYSTKGATCYKKGNPKPVQPPTYTKESCVQRWELYAPDNRNQSFYWCDCPEPVPDACMGSLDLHYNHQSSCTVYCENSKEKPVVSSCEGKNLKDKNGNMITCEFGCQDNGTSVDDICSPEPITIPQEIDCTKYTDMSSCRWAGSGCEWSFADQKCTTGGSVSPDCSTISLQSTCNSKANCEYVEGKCQEINLLNYRKNNEGPDYCSGLRDKDGKVISIGYGPDNIATHKGKSKCSIDLSAYEVNLGNQISGYKINPETKKGEWSAGYTCEVATRWEAGYGNSVIVTQPDGTKIRYAHLKYDSCTNLVTGNTGGWPYHLHVEVECTSAEECAICLGDKNPCRALAGGCFNCEDTVKAEAIFKDRPVGAEAKMKSPSFFSLISKIRAEETENIDPAVLIKDIELQEGKYTITSGTANKETSFVKTDNNQIVFFDDANSNGKLDTDESILSPYEAQVEYQVSFDKVADSFKLSLQEGLNLVSFPIVFKNDKEEEIKKASELIEYLNKQGTEITTITAYRGGKFIPYVIREGKGFGDDFNILPGEGYFIFSHVGGDFLHSGTKVKDGLEIQLYEGWNLVNIYNSNVKSYSGFDVLKKMKEQSIGADIISKWEDGMYINIVSEESGEYGNDFEIYQNRGYFVRVAENGGPFTPK